MALPNPTMDFTPFDILTAEEMDQIVENIESLADGSGLDTGAVSGDKISTGAITLGYAQITSNYSNSSTADTDIPGLSVNVVVPAGGRRIRISGFTGSASTTSGSNAIFLSIREGSTVYAFSQPNIPNNENTPINFPVASFVASAGSHTYKMTISNAIATSVTLLAVSNSPAFILVEAI